MIVLFLPNSSSVFLPPKLQRSNRKTSPIQIALNNTVIAVIPVTWLNPFPHQIIAHIRVQTRKRSQKQESFRYVLGQG